MPKLRNDKNRHEKDIFKREYNETMKNQSHFTRNDADELQKFENMAEDWWNPQGNFKTLHDVNPLRLQYIQSQVSLHQCRVLDVACGGGLLSEAMARQGAITTGIDLGAKAIQTAKLHLKESTLNVDYQCIDVQSLAAMEKKKEYYDVVTCLELLEHVSDPAEIITACSKLTIPHGYVFFSTLNRTLESFLTTIASAEYILKMIPQGTHDYDKFIRPSELAQIAQASKLKLIDMKGISYSPITSKFSLSDKIKSNYLMCFRKRSPH